MTQLQTQLAKLKLMPGYLPFLILKSLVLCLICGTSTRQFFGKKRRSFRRGYWNCSGRQATLTSSTSCQSCVCERSKRAGNCFYVVMCSSQEMQPMLFLYSDGGPDHRLTYMSVKLSPISLFFVQLVLLPTTRLGTLLKESCPFSI